MLTTNFLNGAHADQERVMCMRQTKLTDKEFYQRYDAFDRAAVEELLNAASGDVRNAIDYLVEHRTRIRDSEIARLEKESSQLLGRVQSLDREKLVEELRCFKDVLSLYRDFGEGNDADRR